MRKSLLLRVIALLVPLSLLAVALIPIYNEAARSQAGRASSASLQAGRALAKAWDRADAPAQRPRAVQSIPPQISFDANSGKPGQSFGFAGNGFLPNEGVEVRLSTPDEMPPMRTSFLLATATANARGELAGRATVPFVLPAGNYLLLVLRSQDQTPIIQNFAILAFTPWVVLEDYAPMPSAFLGFQGEDFAAGETVRVYLDQQGNQPILQVTAGPDGQFVAHHAVESPDQPGEHSLIFVGSTSKVVARVSFEVQTPQPTPMPQPTPTPSPALSWAPGSTARSVGRGQPQQMPIQADSASPQYPSVVSTRSAPGGISLEDPTTLVLVALIGWFILSLLLVLPLAVPSLLRRRAARKQAEESDAQALRRRASAQAGAAAQPPARAELLPASAPAVLLPDLPPDSQPALQPAQPVLSAVAHTAQGSEGAPVQAQPRPQLGMQVCSASDRGKAHAHRENADRFLSVTGARRVAGLLQPFGLFVVADGSGSRHAAGAEASRMTIEALYRRLVPLLPREDLATDDLVALLAATIRSANTLLNLQSQDQRHRLGCTITAVLVTNGEVAICHVGKNRGYLLAAQGPLRRVTVDHSIVESLVVAGFIQREQVYSHPMRNRIYRCLGHGQQVQIDRFRLPLAPGDQLLLCSDGLWQMLRDPLIEGVLRQSPDVCQANKTLVALANEQGGLDNITAILIKLTDTLQPAQRPGIGCVNSNQALDSR